MNVPKLRFKEFNDEWVKFYTGDLCDIQTGKSNTQDKIENGLYPFYVRSAIVEHSNKYIFDTEAVLTVGDGVGTGKVFHYVNGKFDCHQRVYVMNNFKNVTAKFFYYLFSKDFIKRVNSMTAKTSVDSVRYEMIDKMIMYLPTLYEQQKIGTFLSLLDKKIELQSKKIEALKLYKKGLVKLSIKKIKVNKISLKEVLKEYNEKSTINNQYEVISSTSKGLFLQSEYFNKQQASQNNIGYKILKKGQLVISPQNLWMGNINLNLKYNLGIVSPSYKIYDIDTKKVDINYFNYWIKTPKALYQYLISSEQGASIVRRNLNLDLFYEITIDLPEKLDQVKIGNFINLFEQKIVSEEKNLIQLIKLKKGLMQNMFV